MQSLRAIEREFSIKAAWGKIAGLTWGSPSDPPILLCHGRQDCCASFRPLVSLLPRNFFYVSIDLPGNGRSEPLPKGVRFTIVDFVPTLVKTVEHFGWKKFVYIGHSLGVGIGKLYNMAYPGYITRVVELDPIPAYHNWPATRQGIRDWYHEYYKIYYKEEQYAKWAGSVDTAPKYSYDEAQQSVMKSRNLSKQASELVLERCLEPAGNGLYRFTFDQRMKYIPVLPFSPEILYKLYTTADTPTFCVIASIVKEMGTYDRVPFVMDKSKWPNGNYDVVTVEGDHDVHLEHPEYMAMDIARFINEEFKAKL